MAIVLILNAFETWLIAPSQQMKELEQIVNNTNQQVENNPQLMSTSVYGTTSTQVPRVEDQPARSRMESVPRVNPIITNPDNIRITRSMSSLNSSSNTTRPSINNEINNNNNTSAAQRRGILIICICMHILNGPF